MCQRHRAVATAVATAATVAGEGEADEAGMVASSGGPASIGARQVPPSLVRIELQPTRTDFEAVSQGEYRYCAPTRGQLPGQGHSRGPGPVRELFWFHGT